MKPQIRKLQTKEYMTPLRLAKGAVLTVVLHRLSSRRLIYLERPGGGQRGLNRLLLTLPRSNGVIDLPFWPFMHVEQQQTDAWRLQWYVSQPFNTLLYSTLLYSTLLCSCRVHRPTSLPLFLHFSLDRETGTSRDSRCNALLLHGHRSAGTLSHNPCSALLPQFLLNSLNIFLTRFFEDLDPQAL